MTDRTRRSAVLMVLDIFLQFLPGFMIYHCVSAVCEILLQTEGCFSLWNGVWLFLLTAGFYFFRYYLPEFHLFFISHLVWLVLFCILLPQNILARVILTVIGVFRGLRGSIQKASRVNERGDKVNLNKVDVEATDPKEGCVVLLSLILALLMGDIEVIYPFLVEPVLFYPAYLLRTHLSRRRLYLDQYEHISHFPVDHMKRTGALVMGVYLLISSICLSAAASYRYLLSDTGPFIWLWEKVKQIFRFLGLLIAKLMDLFGKDFSGETAEEVVKEAPARWMERASETSAFWQFMEQALKIGTFIALAILLVSGVVGIFLEWNRHFQRGKGQSDQIEEYEEIRETWRPREKQIRKRRRGLLFRTPEEKIRRIYIRAVQKNMVRELELSGDLRGSFQTLPPLELDEAIQLHQVVSDEEVLRELYEKARYSGRSMSKEMVIRAREAASEEKKRV